MREAERAKIERATQSANERFARANEREAEFHRERQKQRDADAAKTARLRALRLAKEAAEKEARAKAAAEKPTKLKQGTQRSTGRVAERN
jgi:hypothetical protein